MYCNHVFQLLHQRLRPSFVKLSMNVCIGSHFFYCIILMICHSFVVVTATKRVFFLVFAYISCVLNNPIRRFFWGKKHGFSLVFIDSVHNGMLFIHCCHVFSSWFSSVLSRISSPFCEAFNECLHCLSVQCRIS